MHGANNVRDLLLVLRGSLSSSRSDSHSNETFCQGNGLSLVFGMLFAGALVGQSFAGQHNSMPSRRSTGRRSALVAALPAPAWLAPVEARRGSARRHSNVRRTEPKWRRRVRNRCRVVRITVAASATDRGTGLRDNGPYFEAGAVSFHESERAAATSAGLGQIT